MTIIFIAKTFCLLYLMLPHKVQIHKGQNPTIRPVAGSLVPTILNRKPDYCFCGIVFI